MGSNPSERQQLGLWDCVSIIVGIVIGSTIFKIPNLIFGNTASPWIALAAWGLGGLLALIGALCYAELTTTYPRSGGDYVYLSRAFGPLMGFLFGWAQLVVTLTASISAMAFVFAEFFDQLLPEASQFHGSKEIRTAVYSILAVAVLSGLNILGVSMGKRTQNLLSILKVIGLAMIIGIGLSYGTADLEKFTPPAEPEKLSFGLAMVFVLYAFGGWNDAAFIVAEVKDRKRNLPLALLISTLAITVIYFLVNLAYLRGLGFDGAKNWGVAPSVVGIAFGDWGSKIISAIILTSALGAVNGLIFTGARVYSELGKEYSLFAFLGQWHPKLGSPHWALLAQLLISVSMILGVGTPMGRNWIDQIVGTANVQIPWEKYFGGFDTLVAATAPVFWAFFFLTGLAIFVLRYKDPNRERPFKVPLYPVLPIVFCLTCLYMLYSSLDYVKFLAVVFGLPVLVGIPLYFLSSYRPQPEENV